jgi:2Fe-2S ferredoxin
MATIVFRRDRGRLRVSPGTSLLAAAGRARAPLGQSCRGEGVCNSCRVLVEHGSESLDAATELEERWGLAAGYRLACQARVSPAAADRAVIVLWSPAWGGRPESEGS